MRLHAKAVPRKHGKDGEPDRIVLHSLNPDQPDIEIDENGESEDQRFAVIAEFIMVIEERLHPLEPEWQEPA